MATRNATRFLTSFKDIIYDMVRETRVVTWVIKKLIPDTLGESRQVKGRILLAYAAEEFTNSV